MLSKAYQIIILDVDPTIPLNPAASDAVKERVKIQYFVAIQSIIQNPMTSPQAYSFFDAKLQEALDTGRITQEILDQNLNRKIETVGNVFPTVEEAMYDDNMLNVQEKFKDIEQDLMAEDYENDEEFNERLLYEQSILDEIREAENLKEINEYFADYLNVRCLTNDTLELFTQYLQTPNQDNRFLAETWFKGYENYHRNPLFVCHTSYIPIKDLGCRHKGGIICLASQDVLPLISNYNVHKDWISIELGNINIVACYFPPSMNPSEIEQSLQNVPKIDILLGDINTKFGSLTRIKERGPPEKITLFSKVCSTHSLTHLIPLNDPLVNDHCFIGNNISNTNLAYQKIENINTDHNLLSLSFGSPTCFKEHRKNSTQRFKLNQLCKPLIQTLLCRAYDCLHEITNPTELEISDVRTFIEVREIHQNYSHQQLQF